MKTLTDSQVTKLSETLVGTCMDVNDGLLMMDLVPAEYDSADILSHFHTIENCSDCGWWCESFEMNSDGTCHDCVDPENL